MFALISCNNPKNEGKVENKDDGPEFSVVFLENYFPKNNIEFTSPVKVMVIDNKNRFDEFFGIAQTMKNSATPIDFEKNKVVALISKPSDELLKIQLTETRLKDNNLLVKYKTIPSEAQSFVSSDLKMFSIPKSIYAIDVVIDTEATETTKKS